MKFTAGTCVLINVSESIQAPEIHASFFHEGNDNCV